MPWDKPSIRTVHHPVNSKSSSALFAQSARSRLTRGVQQVEVALLHEALEDLQHLTKSWLSRKRPGSPGAKDFHIVETWMPGLRTHLALPNLLWLISLRKPKRSSSSQTFRRVPLLWGSKLIFQQIPFQLKKQQPVCSRSCGAGWCLSLQPSEEPSSIFMSIFLRCTSLGENSLGHGKLLQTWSQLSLVSCLRVYTASKDCGEFPKKRRTTGSYSYPLGI